jgi:aminoglycoside/choline kinase family phosphotransferase
VKIIDFETMALGPSQIDLAELLKYPACDLAPDVVEELIDYYLARSRRGSDFESRDKFTKVFDCASLSRGLDYAGTVSWRYLTSIKAGDLERAQDYLHRRQWYLDDLRKVLAKFDRLEDTLSILA